MKIGQLILIASILSSCASSVSKMENRNPVGMGKEGLIGEWKQLKPSIDGYTPKVVFTEKTFTFHINENEPYERLYHIHKNFIVGPENPVLKKRDSIKYELIFKDTLILNLKEKGMVYPRKYYRLK